MPHSATSPCIYLCRASGEGIADVRVCRTVAEVRAFYAEEFCGDDYMHREEVDAAMKEFADPDNWAHDAFCEELYCATWEVWRVPADFCGRSETAGCNLVPIEWDELIRFHDSAAAGAMQSDDFGGERYHRTRADLLRKHRENLYGTVEFPRPKASRSATRENMPSRESNIDHKLEFAMKHTGHEEGGDKPREEIAHRIRQSVAACRSTVGGPIERGMVRTFPLELAEEAADVIDALAKAYVAEREALLKAARSSGLENVDVIGMFQSKWNEALEAAAAIVDQCNREGPYNAIGAASRIRDLKNHAPHNLVSATRENVLEEAAKVCDALVTGATYSSKDSGKKECAAAIRALILEAYVEPSSKGKA